jgi:hypothetical protein
MVRSASDPHVGQRDGVHLWEVCVLKDERDGIRADNEGLGGNAEGHQRDRKNKEERKA